ncbi:hypothetical protein Hypma_005544 [Hypsizygus marmoreus]|uniref:Uncharacterized protein n=1 Tax=Hypsizygus marmoreus TaxID=39966 RepID=A0A369JWA8_HYPMA|nr:hypothetical protein Hypma_005544 [Hypsizygus marmoreus]
MSSFFNKLKAKMHKKSASQDKPSTSVPESKPSEPTFSTLPHPAKTNDPADLQPKQPGGGLATSDSMAAHHARDPYIPSPEIVNKLEEPLSREQLRARAAELNADGN